MDMCDEVKVYFDDDTTTIIVVSEDERIADRLADLAEEEGVVNYSIIGQAE